MKAFISPHFSLFALQALHFPLTHEKMLNLYKDLRVESLSVYAFSHSPLILSFNVVSCLYNVYTNDEDLLIKIQSINAHEGTYKK